MTIVLLNNYIHNLISLGGYLTWIKKVNLIKKKLTCTIFYTQLGYNIGKIMKKKLFALQVEQHNDQ